MKLIPNLSIPDDQVSKLFLVPMVSRKMNWALKDWKCNLTTGGRNKERTYMYITECAHVCMQIYTHVYAHKKLRT